MPTLITEQANHFHLITAKTTTLCWSRWHVRLLYPVLSYCTSGTML